MITLRKAKERGHANHGWLDSYHTFSFASYYDPNYMGFRSLRVINEDRVHPTKGFAPHSHRDMEIITYILEGALEHKDSMGNSSVINPGEVQIMSAGTGVTHSEYNPSDSQGVHFLQIWILPDTQSLQPSYQQKMYDASKKQGKLCLIASPDGREDSVTIHQDVNLYATVLASGDKISYDIKPNRHVWLQITQGEINLNGELLTAGDAAAISAEKQLEILAIQSGEMLLFDLA